MNSSVVHLALRNLLAGGSSLMTPAEFDELAALVREERVSGGEALMRMGEDADALGIVVSGRVRVGFLARESNQQSSVIAELAPGAIVGEMGLLGHGTRTADAWATRDSIVGWLRGEDIERACQRFPALGLTLARVLAARSSGPDNGVGTSRHAPHVLAVVGVGPLDTAAGLALRELATTIANTLAVRLGDASLAVETDAELAVTRAAQHPLVWVGPSTDNGLAQLVRQCDRVLLVVSADASPSEVHRLVAVLPPMPIRPELALMHPNGVTDPSATSAWISSGVFRAHHHLRADNRSTYETAARRIVGSAVGLVLSGGGARGLAHLGVARVLHEAGVTFDYIGGSSMGAIVGGLIARFGASRDLEVRTLEALAKHRIERDFGIPRGSLLRGKALRAVITMAFGDLAIEDLWTDWFCTSTNATTRGLDIHRTGSLQLWATATASVPGLLPPVVDREGNVHLDGGLSDNLPADHLRERGASTVIAVDVGHQNDFAVDEAPSLAETLHLSLGLASARRRVEVEPSIDILLSPAVGDFGMMSFSEGRQIIEAGVRCAEQMLAAGAFDRLRHR